MSARKAASRILPCREIPETDDSSYAGRTLYVEGRTVRTSLRTEPGTSLASRTILAREYPADSDLWRWLGEHGVERPSLSGPSGMRRAPNPPAICYRPSPAARVALEALADRDGASLSGTLDRLVLGAVLD